LSLAIQTHTPLPLSIQKKRIGLALSIQGLFITRIGESEEYHLTKKADIATDVLFTVPMPQDWAISKTAHQKRHHTQISIFILIEVAIDVVTTKKT